MGGYKYGWVVREDSKARTGGSVGRCVSERRRELVVDVTPFKEPKHHSKNLNTKDVSAEVKCLTPPTYHVRPRNRIYFGNESVPEILQTHPSIVYTCLMSEAINTSSITVEKTCMMPDCHR